MREHGDLSKTTSKGTYYYQVCSEVSACSSLQTSVCLKQHGKSINAGETHSAIWSVLTQDEQYEGVAIMYSNGDVCGNDKSNRKTIVNLRCNSQPHNNPVIEERGVNTFMADSTVDSVDDSDDCTTVINVTTSFACPTNRNFISDCSFRSTKEACFEPTGGSCYCAWCVDKCVAGIDECPTGREFQCNEHWTGVSVHGFGIIFGIISLIFCLTCLSICICIKKRRYSKMTRIRNGLQMATQKKHVQEMAMEPLIQSELPVMDQSVQFVYVQVPMNNSDQQHPPYFAPQPFFLAPQFIQPTGETRQ